MLRTLAAFLRDDLAARREIEARQSWTVVAARVAAAAPWVVLLLVSSRAQGARAFDSTAGFAVLVGGAARHRPRLPSDGPRRTAAGGAARARGATRMTITRVVGVVLVGLSGLALARSSALPRFRRPVLSRRLLPYLGALGPRRSNLVAPDGMDSGWAAVLAPVCSTLADRLSRLLGDGLDLPERLAAAGTTLDVSGFRLEQVTWGLVGGTGGAALGRSGSRGGSGGLAGVGRGDDRGLRSRRVRRA